MKIFTKTIKSRTFDGMEYRALLTILREVTGRIPALKPQSDKLSLVLREKKELESDSVIIEVTFGDLQMMLAFAKLADGFNNVQTAEVWANPGLGGGYSFETLSGTNAIIETVTDFISEWDVTKLT